VLIARRGSIPALDARGDESMKILRLITLRFVLVLCVASTSAACQEQRRRPSRYLIPEGYVGWVRIDFNIKDAPSLPIEDGQYLFKFPSSGRIQTSSDIEYGGANDDYYYYSGDTRRLLKSTGWGKGGMIWAGFNGKAQDEKEVYEYFFVGTEEELKEFGWEEKDEAGIHPKVGPIKPLPASNNSFNRSGNSAAFIRQLGCLFRYVPPG
jgi:hypothetical protein